MSPENHIRRDALLDATCALMVRYGYDKTTVADIAREAGVSKGSVYLHFDSKEALFEALLVRERHTYVTTWLELTEADPEGGRIGAMYRNSLRALAASPLMQAMLTRDRTVLSSYLKRPNNVFSRNPQGSGMRREFLELMQRAGTVRSDVDVDVAAHMMNMLSVALVISDDVLAMPQGLDIERVIEGIGGLMERALEPEGGGDSEAGKAIVRTLLAGAMPGEDEAAGEEEP